MSNTGDSASPARRAARLSMLAPDAEAEARIARELSSVIDFADELNALQPSRETAREVCAPSAALRPDVPKAGLCLSEALMNAKAVSGRLITIPRAFD